MDVRHVVRMWNTNGWLLLKHCYMLVIVLQTAEFGGQVKVLDRNKNPPTCDVNVCPSIPLIPIYRKRK